MASKIDRILFTAIVTDNKDPYMLGRVRAIPEQEFYSEILKSVPDECAIFDNQKNIVGIKKECEWEMSDPFVYLPLLPFHINVVPMISEIINIITPFVQNAASPYRTQASNNQYYLQGSYSSPMASPKETYPNAKAFTSQGDLVKKHYRLRNKDKLGTYTDIRSKGIFPEPGDNYLLGRGNSDIIVKPNEVLLRSGKTRFLNPKQPPLPNDNRGFLQLSTFEQTRSGLIKNTEEVLIKFIKKTKNVIKLVEWHIENLENAQDRFMGYVYIYNVKPDGIKTNTDNFDMNTIITPTTQLPGSVRFENISFGEVVNLVNSFIRGLNDGYIPFFPKHGNVGTAVPNAFPFYFRPSSRTYSKIQNYATNTSPNRNIEFNNATKFMNSIKLKDTDKQSGQGLVSSRGYLGPFVVPKIEELFESFVDNQSISYGILGSEKLFLLSQDSNNPNRGKIDFSNTIYGFNDNDIADKNLQNKTSSTVRGEELLELLNMIVIFLLGHVHAHPGLPPDPVSQDGLSAQTLMDKLNKAYTEVLNSNIRIN
jgi:hypothetical protein